MKIREYKARARKALIGKYGLLFLAQVLMGGIVSIAVFGAVFCLLAGIGMFLSGQEAGEAFGALLGAEVGFVVLFLLFLIAGIVLSYVMGIGFVKLCLNICRGVPHGFSDLFYAFRKGSHPLRYLGINLLLVLLYLVLMAVYYLGLFVITDMAGMGEGASLLWSLIWFIGFCWLFLGFAFAPLLVIDKPETRVGEAFSESRRLMKHRKIKYVLLSLSFILWFIPLYLTFFIASIWIYPYMTFATLLFYLDASGELYVSDWDKPEGGQVAASEPQQPAGPELQQIAGAEPQQTTAAEPQQTAEAGSQKTPETEQEKPAEDAAFPWQRAALENAQAAQGTADEPGSRTTETAPEETEKKENEENRS